MPPTSDGESVRTVGCALAKLVPNPVHLQKIRDAVATTHKATRGQMGRVYGSLAQMMRHRYTDCYYSRNQHSTLNLSFPLPIRERFEHYTAFSLDLTYFMDECIRRVRFPNTAIAPYSFSKQVELAASGRDSKESIAKQRIHVSTREYFDSGRA